MALTVFTVNRALFCAKFQGKIISRSLQLAALANFESHKPPPFDYLRTGYPQWLMFDNTKHRFNENTKVICVEGNICSGKGYIASKIAEYFGMIHYPDPTDDDIYTLRQFNPPVDIRMHNTLLPKDAQYFTTEMFWTTKDLQQNGKPMYLQYQYYLRRYWNYLIGLCTLFNTGKGAVFDRCHFSDLAFVEALHKCKYISDYAFDWFTYVHTNTALNLWKPHLVVYIKTNTDIVRSEIKKKGIKWQIDAVNLNPNFIYEYKLALETYLERMSRYSEIFVIDRTNTDIFDENELRIIMEKLTYFDYEGERLIRDDYKFLEWRNGVFNERAATFNRGKFSSAYMKFVSQFKKFRIPRDMTEAIYTFDAKEMQYHIYKLDPRLKYVSGYDPSKDSLMRIMFDPFLENKNFRENWPAYFLTSN